MKLVLKVRNLKNGNEWTEDYDSDDLPDPDHLSRRRCGGRVTAETPEQATEWGKTLVARFNDTDAPGEARREMISAELVPVEVSP